MLPSAVNVSYGCHASRDSFRPDSLSERLPRQSPPSRETCQAAVVCSMRVFLQFILRPRVRKFCLFALQVSLILFLHLQIRVGIREQKIKIKRLCQDASGVTTAEVSNE